MVLEKVCEYFYYNEKNRDSTGVADLDIPPELCLELLMAADYLNGVSSSLLHQNYSSLTHLSLMKSYASSRLSSVSRSSIPAKAFAAFIALSTE